MYLATMSTTENNVVTVLGHETFRDRFGAVQGAICMYQAATTDIPRRSNADVEYTYGMLNALGVHWTGEQPAYVDDPYVLGGKGVEITIRRIED